MDSSETEKRSPATCPRCGVALPPDAPEKLCPRCLMAVNLETETMASGDAAPRTTGPAPDIDSLREHFPQLEIHECLGRGGMGVVYRALQKSLNRPVALKLLDPERAKDPGFAERFKKEAHALAALNHPNIVTIHDHGEAGGHYFLTMEFVDGVNLRQAMSAGRFTPEEALAIVPPVCEALQYAHDNGIVHRDIKPENLLLDKDGRVMIADFGVAKIMGQTETAGDTGTTAETGSISGGTPRYMAPEQTENPGHVDHRADIYAMGVVLYELLTGETPSKGEIEPPSRQVEVDVRIDEIVLRALEKEPELRYATAADFRTQVETVAPQLAKPTPAVSGKGLSRGGAWWWTIFAIPLAALAICCGSMLLAEGLEEFRIDANRFLMVTALIGALAFGVWLISRTRRALASAGPDQRVVLDPPWLGIAGMVLAGLAGFLGFIALISPGPGRILPVLIPVCAVLGVGAGILARKNALAWTAIIVGSANLLIAIVVTAEGWERSDRGHQTATISYPEGAHIGRGGKTVMLFHSDDSLDYAAFRDGDFNSSSQGSRNLASQVWVEDFELRFRETNRSISFLRESLNPLFVKIDGMEHDLRKGRVFHLTDDGKAEQLRLFPPLATAREPEELAKLVEAELQAVPAFGATIDLRVNGFSSPNGDDILRLEDGTLFSVKDLVPKPDGVSEVNATWLTESRANLFADTVDNDHWNLALRDVELAELADADWNELDARSFSARLEGLNWITGLPLLGGMEILDLENGFRPPRTYAFRTGSGEAGMFRIARLDSPLEGPSINLRYKRLEKIDSRNLQRFIPKAGMENKASWSVIDKPSGLNPDGWTVIARLPLGGIAQPILPGNSEPTLMKLESGDNEAVTIEISDRSREQKMTFDLARDQPAEMTLNGKGYRLLFPTTDVGPLDSSTTHIAFIIVKPANSSEANSEPRRERFEPKAGMEKETLWSFMPKGSPLNPDGWAVYTRMTLGGKAPIQLPDEDSPRAEITLLEGDDKRITLKIEDFARKHTSTLSLIRDRPAEISIDGEGYRVLFMQTYIGPDDPPNSPEAHVIVTPAGQPKIEKGSEEEREN